MDYFISHHSPSESELPCVPCNSTWKKFSRICPVSHNLFVACCFEVRKVDSNPFIVTCISQRYQSLSPQLYKCWITQSRGFYLRYCMWQSRMSISDPSGHETLALVQALQAWLWLTFMFWGLDFYLENKCIDIILLLRVQHCKALAFQAHDINLAREEIV